LIVLKARGFSYDSVILYILLNNCKYIILYKFLLIAWRQLGLVLIYNQILLNLNTHA